MNLDRYGRILALALLPVVGIVVYFAPRPAPPSHPTPSADLSTAPAGIGIPPIAASPLGKALHERGEAALAQSGALPVTPAPPEPAPRDVPPKSKLTHTARDLPLAQAEDAPHPSGPPQRPTKVGLGPCGGVTVRGITDSPDPEWAFAMLAAMPTDRAKITRAGDPIGSYRVQSIEWDRVWLMGGGGRCAVRLAEGAREAAEATGDMPLTVDPGITTASAPWRLSGELRNAIEVAGFTVRVDPAVVAALFDGGAQWISGMEVTPRRENERNIGVVFARVKEGSLLHHVGIRSGDLLRTLDNTPAESLARIGEALLAARKAERVLLELERDGTRIQILVELA